MAFLSGYLLLFTCLIYIFKSLSRRINKRDGNDETSVMLELNQPSHHAGFFFKHAIVASFVYCMNGWNVFVHR